MSELVAIRVYNATGFTVARLSDGQLQLIFHNGHGAEAAFQIAWANWELAVGILRSRPGAFAEMRADGGRSSLSILRLHDDLRIKHCDYIVIVGGSLATELLYSADLVKK